MSTTDPTPHDAVRPGDALADQVFVDPGRETSATASPQGATPPATGSPAHPASADGPWLTGPAPFAIVLGILGLLVAGAVLLTELTDLTVPWADLGPWTVVAAGVVVVLVGAIGLRSSRRAQA